MTFEAASYLLVAVVADTWIGDVVGGRPDHRIPVAAGHQARTQAEELHNADSRDHLYQDHQDHSSAETSLDQDKVDDDFSRLRHPSLIRPFYLSKDVDHAPVEEDHLSNHWVVVLSRLLVVHRLVHHGLDVRREEVEALLVPILAVAVRFHMLVRRPTFRTVVVHRLRLHKEGHRDIAADVEADVDWLEEVLGVVDTKRHRRPPHWLFRRPL